MVKWYNPAKSFGFVTPDVGAWELILHRSAFGQISLSEIGEGIRVLVQVEQGIKGPQVTTIQLA